jgi:curved DNA-binding protein CbpA
MDSEFIFVDYYDVLQVSTNADTDTIKRIFRYLAKRSHPDSQGGGNPELFRQLVKAHDVLTDPEKRAAYDVKYQEYWDRKWKIVRQAANGPSSLDTKEARDRILTLLYVQRRTDPQHPGMGELELARMLRLPVEFMEFDIWYLRQKGFVERLETGLLAISVNGVDKVEKSSLRLSPDRLLEASNDHPAQTMPSHDLLGSSAGISIWD